MYVDESGDIGVSSSGADFYALSGIVVQELSWQNVLNDFLEFRRSIRNHYQWKVRQKFHNNCYNLQKRR